MLKSRLVDDNYLGTCANLTQSLNAARATGAYERKLAALAKVPLLIIDDFGLKPLRAPFDEDLHDLISERYRSGKKIAECSVRLDGLGGTNGIAFSYDSSASPGSYNEMLTPQAGDQSLHFKSMGMA